jgi:hypothetical protein
MDFTHESDANHAGPEAKGILRNGLHQQPSKGFMNSQPVVKDWSHVLKK